MKSIIGIVLFVFWMLLVCLLCAEPTDETVFEIEGQWAGYVYLFLLFGLPFAWGNLLKDK
jgi:hypothetical protein